MVSYIRTLKCEIERGVDVMFEPKIRNTQTDLLMKDRKETYQKIADETGASSATISRVNRCLTYGADGYRRVLDAMGDNEKA